MNESNNAPNAGETTPTGSRKRIAKVYDRPTVPPKRTALLVGLGVFVLLVIGLFVYFMLRPHPDATPRTSFRSASEIRLAVLRLDIQRNVSPCPGLS